MITIRSLAFWTLDALRGGNVRKHFREVALMMDDVHFAERQRALRLRSLLEHAVLQVPFYRDLGRSPSLNEFPVVNKGVIRDHADEMLDQTAARDQLHVTSTSGSTGTPFHVYQDRAKRNRVNAEAIYWGSRAGYVLGTRLFHLKVWSDRNRMRRFDQVLRNVRPVDTGSAAREQLLRIVEIISRPRGSRSVISYSSTLEMIGKLLDESAMRGKFERLPRVKSIIGQSESLSSEARRALRNHFHVTPYGRYGLEEVGIVAQQVPGSGEDYLVNRASQIVEVLQLEKDEAARPGELGRIVVTDLANKAQPMIRYDTGDLGQFKIDGPEHVDERWLRTIQGRRIDQIYDANDEPLSTMFMYRVWWKYPEIWQYQLVQEERARYLLRLNMGGGALRQNELLDDMRAILGVHASIRVEQTNESLVFGSGKRRAVVGHYNPVDKGAIGGDPR